MTTKKHFDKIPRLDLNSADLLAVLGVAVLAYSVYEIYPPAAGIIVGLFLLAVASRKGTS